MTFGIPELLMALTAASSANSLFGKEDTNQFGGGIPAGAGPPPQDLLGNFSLPIPEATTPGQTLANPGQALNIQAPAAPAPQQTAPTVPLTPTKGPGRPEAAQEAALDSSANIGEILAAAPEALLAVADLLGFNQQRDEERAAPVPGGTAGNLVQGFNLPTSPGIGQLLAQIPRLG